MYNERRDSFSMKTVIVQFLFVALFIFILIWLFPMKSDLKNALNNSSETTDLSVFYDKIFNDNVIAMKDAAKSYYTTARLPKNVGDKVSMTLGEMLDKKIILPFVDSKGKQCSLTDSYVEITKYDEEFVMKVNLKCSEQENYLLVYMGCYDYCSTAICEKNQSDIKTPVIYPSKPVTPTQPEKPVVNNNVTNITNITNNITNNIVNNNNVTIIKPVPEEPEIPEIMLPLPEIIVTPTNPSCTLEVISGSKSGDLYTEPVVVGFKSKEAGENAKLTGFGLGLGTNADYNSELKVEIDPYTKDVVALSGNNISNNSITVYGYVKNSYGNTAICSINLKFQANKEEKESTPSCTLEVISGSKNGNAYTGPVVVGFKSKEAGENAKLTGYGLGTSTNYKGDTKYSLTKSGNHTVYGYVKNSYGKTAVCSIKVNIQDKKKEYEYEYAKNTTTCSDYSTWSTWSTKYIEPTNLRQVAYRKLKVTSITGYKTITKNDTSKPIYGTKEVAVGTLSEKVCTEYGYTKTGSVAYTDWQYQGYITTTSILKNTDLEKYVPVTDTETLCQEYCSSTTGHVYKKYTRTAVSGVKYTCKNTATATKLITAKKSIITGYEKITTKEAITETKIVTEYRYRTRTCNTKTDKKWSYYNNKNLLNAGYNYTGSKREK